jgi:hypothetical protein
MDRILRVFISSAGDTKTERKVVVEALLKLGVTPLLWEHFSGFESTSDQIAASDGMIQIIGNRLGSFLPESFGKCVTGMKHDAMIAREKNIPLFVLQTTDNRNLAALRAKECGEVSFVQFVEQLVIVDQYVKELRESGHRVYQFSSLKELETLVGNLDLWGAIATSRNERGFKVFISYRRKEPISDCVTHRLYERMTQKMTIGSVFLDSHSIPLGMDYRDYLTKSVVRSNFMCVIIGPTWLASLRERLESEVDYVRYEIATAIRHRIPVCPLLLGDSTSPTKVDLPDDLAHLVYSQGMRIRVGSDLFRDLDDLIQRIQSLLPKTSNR